ncbi:MAG: PD40 domain-containing protein [Spirochaetes bacterium]|nr:PD40 domain-containing protein [Spirochaetota bacterium]
MKKFILSIFLLLPLNLFSANMFDPGLDWKSIKTEHFWVHYHQGIEDTARKVCLIAEKVHNRITPRIEWDPFLRTDIVLVDNMYTANGFATTFPFNRIQIYLTRPELDGQLNNFNNWLEEIITHEYTHILNLDTAHGLPAVLRYGIGRFPLFFPNMFVPIWMLEGNAVYFESNYSRSGRNNSTFTDMIIRTEVLNDSLKSISEASGYPRVWPGGSIPYLYGGLFVNYLENKYGQDSFAKVFIYNSNKIIPYQDHIFPYTFPFIKSMSEWIYEEDFPALWKEWQKYIKIKYNSQLNAIKEEKLTPFKIITDSGCYTSLPRFSRNGQEVYYVRKTNYNKSILSVFSKQNNKHKTLCKVNDPNSISTNKNDVYVSDAEFHKSFSIYNEAFVYNNRYRKLTKSLKGSYIDVSPGAEKAVFIKQHNNKFSLLMTDLKFTNFEPLIQNTDIQLAFTKLSPDGGKIAFTIKDSKGNADIAVMNTSSGAISRLSNDKYNDIHPCWHPDGNKIIFSSDRDGVYNFYEYDLQKKVLSRITNFLGGGLSPDISPDGKQIAFTNYGKNGFDIALMKYPEPIKIEDIESETISSQFFNNTPVDPVTESNDYETDDFTVFNSIIPPFWLPLFGNSEVYEDKTQFVLGFATLGTDALYKNTYIISALAYTYEKRAAAGIFYNFSYFYPDIVIGYENEALFYGNDKFPWENKNKNSLKRELEEYGIFGIALPFYFYQSYHVLSMSYIYSKTTTDIYYPGRYTVGYEDTEASIRLKYIYSNSSLYSYSVCNEDGRDFYVIGDLFREELGSDFSYSKFRAEYAEYLPGVWNNNVLMLRLRGGASFFNPDYKSPYNLGRFEKGETGVPETDEDEFGLRGYPSGTIYGDRIATGTLEYRLPLFQTDFGLATFPLSFKDLWITPFAEYGNVWKKNTNINKFKSSAGIELNIRMTIGYRIDLQGYIGCAKGFNDNGESQVYFAISTIFEGALKNNYKWLDYF